MQVYQQEQNKAISDIQTTQQIQQQQLDHIEEMQERQPGQTEGEFYFRFMMPKCINHKVDMIPVSPYPDKAPDKANRNADKVTNCPKASNVNEKEK